MATVRVTIKALKRVSLAKGLHRSIYRCTTCGKVQSHDYIPFGIGTGFWRNSCMDNAVSSNWIIREAKLVAQVRG